VILRALASYQPQRAALPRRAARRLRFLAGLRVLPARVAWFYWRADRVARRTEDRWSLDSAVRPAEAAQLIELARGRKAVAELGTGTAWSAIILALADDGRRVITCDPVVRDERTRYLSLVRPGVRERIELVTATGTDAARSLSSVDMVFIDSSHERADTIAEFEAWRPLLGDAGVVAFHDYGHPTYPGVAEAIRELELQGESENGLFVWNAAGAAKR
jgi:predicted O-methyltransferase YrrM